MDKFSDIAKKIANSKASSGGTPIRDGAFKFALVNFLLEEKESGICCIIELLVKESRSKVDGVEANPVGSICSYVINLSRTDNAGRAAPGNVKAFVCGLAGHDKDSVNPDEFEALVLKLRDKAQPARGMLIGDDTWRKPIKSGERKGQPFVGHNWLHVAGQTAESIAAERKAIDAMLGAA